jgi:hypothetical protein
MEAGHELDTGDEGEEVCQRLEFYYLAGSMMMPSSTRTSKTDPDSCDSHAMHMAVTSPGFDRQNTLTYALSITSTGKVCREFLLG